MYKNIKKFRYAVQFLIMHIPVVKDIIIYKEVIMFTKTFSSLVKHDVFITDSIEMLGKITGNEIYKNIIKAFGTIMVKIVNKIPLKLKLVSIKVTVNPSVNPFNAKVTNVIGENIMLVLNKMKITIGTATVKNVVLKI